jgi:hypothetical protein
MKINKPERESETESENLQDPDLKVITENSLKLKSKVKKTPMSSVRNGDFKIREVSLIDLSELKCQDILLQEKQVKAQEIGDDIIFSFKNDRLILFISF